MSDQNAPSPLFNFHVFKASFDSRCFRIGVTSLCPCSRLRQLQASGDRKDILAVDGNCKFHRRTCGVPFAVKKLLFRGCSCKPSAKDTLCGKHAADRDRPLEPMRAQIGRRRLKKALHSPGDFCFLEVQMSGYRSCQLAPSRKPPWPNILQNAPARTLRRGPEAHVVLLQTFNPEFLYKKFPLTAAHSRHSHSAETEKQGAPSSQAARQAAARAKNCLGIMVFSAVARKQLLSNSQRIGATYCSCRADCTVPPCCERVKTALVQSFSVPLCILE